MSPLESKVDFRLAEDTLCGPDVPEDAKLVFLLRLLACCLRAWTVLKVLLGLEKKDMKADESERLRFFKCHIKSMPN